MYRVIIKTHISREILFVGYWPFPNEPRGHIRIENVPYAVFATDYNYNGQEWYMEIIVRALGQ